MNEKTRIRTVEKREHESKENPYLVLKNGFNNGRRYSMRGLHCLLNLKNATVSDFGEVEVRGIVYILNGGILTDLADYRSQKNIQRKEFFKNQKLLEQKV